MQLIDDMNPFLFVCHEQEGRLWMRVIKELP